jgi:hypothetical protein
MFLKKYIIRELNPGPLLGRQVYYHCTNDVNSVSAGFEPARAEPNRFQVYLLKPLGHDTSGELRD